jgi:hypothetical protein
MYAFISKTTIKKDLVDSNMNKITSFFSPLASAHIANYYSYQYQYESSRTNGRRRKNIFAAYEK